MSAIAAVLAADPKRRGICASLIDAMGHRGDASLAVETEGASIQTRGDGNLASADGIVVAIDGQVHNHRELHGEGIAEGSAAEVILGGYARWGTDVVKRLRGDFAIVISDGPGKRLLCARDAFGMRPLYYHRSADRLLVASEAQALRASGVPSARPNLKSIAEYIACQYAENGATLREEIEALPPGHYLLAKPDGVSVHRHWCPDPWKKLDVGDEEAAAMFADVFADAVRCRLPSSGNLGVMLSGGLDSASVACQAAALGAAPTALHVSITGYECDETPLSRAVAAKWGLDTIDVEGEGREMAEAYRPRPRHPDALYHISHASFWALFRRAREAGVSAVMTGIGGDECADETGAELLDAIRAGNLREVAAFAALDREPWSWAPYRRIWNLGLKRWVPEPWRLATRKLRHRQMLVPFVSRDWVKRLEEQYVENRRRQLMERWPDDATAEMWHRIQQFPLRVGATQVNLSGVVTGVEVSHPFLDQRVFELALAMPHSQRMRNGWLKNKPMLRRAMSPLLPTEVSHRRDAANFMSYLRDVYVRQQRREIMDLFEDNRLADLGVIDLPAVRSAFDAGLPDGSSLNHFGLILSMEYWLRQESS